MQPLLQRTCLFFWKIYHRKLIKQCGSKMTIALHIMQTKRDKHIIVSDVLDLFGGHRIHQTCPCYCLEALKKTTHKHIHTQKKIRYHSKCHGEIQTRHPLNTNQKCYYFRQHVWSEMLKFGTVQYHSQKGTTLIKVHDYILSSQNQLSYVTPHTRI
jgi:hypothetical protein